MSSRRTTHQKWSQSLTIIPLKNVGLTSQELSEYEKSGKVFLPINVIEYFQFSDENIATFRLTNEKNGKFTDVGVVDFTANPGEIYVPEWIIEKLASFSDKIRVENIDLDKLSSITFKSTSEDFDYLDVQSKLESLEKLSQQFTAINVGDRIVTDSSYGNYDLLVKSLETIDDVTGRTRYVKSAHIIGNLEPMVDFIDSDQTELNRLKVIEQEENEKLRREQRQLIAAERARELASRSSSKTFGFNPLNVKPVQVKPGVLTFGQNKPSFQTNFIEKKSVPFSGSGNVLGSSVSRTSMGAAEHENKLSPTISGFANQRSSIQSTTSLENRLAMAEARARAAEARAKSAEVRANAAESELQNLEQTGRIDRENILAANAIPAITFGSHTLSNKSDSHSMRRSSSRSSNSSIDFASDIEDEWDDSVFN